MCKTVAKQMDMQLPEKSVSEICQIFFCIGTNIQNALNDRYEFGIDLFKRTFSHKLKHLEIIYWMFQETQFLTVYLKIIYWNIYVFTADVYRKTEILNF
mgnify:CR=1 FL=1